MSLGPAKQVRGGERATDDVARLRGLVQAFTRSFGLLVTRQTPCGLPISPSYAHCLMLLRERERAGLQTTQSDLATELGIDKSNVARLCAQLQRAGHAVRTRSPSDGRERLVSLGPKGARLAERLERASRARFERVLCAVPAARRVPLLLSLEDLVGAVAGLAGESQ